MKVTDKAEKELNRLTGGEDFCVPEQDKDFAAMFLNFALDEIPEKCGLDERTRAMVNLAALVGAQSPDLYKQMVMPAVRSQLKPEEIKEIVYQGGSYLGMARIYPFIKATNEIFKANGICENKPEVPDVTQAERRQKGAVVMEKIFGPGAGAYADGGPETLRRMRQVVEDNGFSDYYRRPVLTIEQREIITFCFLSALGGSQDELISHVKTNLRLGKTQENMISIVLANLPWIGYPRSWEAIHAIDAAVSADMKKMNF